MNLTRVLYHLAADYHSGQWSRGYRLLCHCQRRLKRHHNLPVPPIDSLFTCLEEWRLYIQLAARYGDKL